MDKVKADLPKIIREFKSGKYSKLYQVEYNSKIMMYKEFSTKLNTKKSYIKANYQLISNISHPNLIKMVKWVENGDSFGFIMEYFPGQDISIIENRSFEITIRAMVDVCSGLDILHEKGIVHRDLTPENILCNGDLQIKITDFDWIKKEGNPVVTADFAGKAKYISPEQCRNDDKIDQRSDLYSLGIILYELYYGKAPFTGKDWLEIARKHLNNEVNFPAKNPQLNKILKRLLEKDKQNRFQNAGDVALALSKLIGESEKLIQPKSLYLLPPKFVGRKKIINKIRKSLDKNIPVIITGKKGVGKSELVKQIAFAQTEEKITIKLSENENIFYLLAKIIYHLLENTLSGLAAEVMSVMGDDLIDLDDAFNKYSTFETADKVPNEQAYFYRFGYLIKLIWKNVLFILEDVEKANMMSLRFLLYLVGYFQKKCRLLITLNPLNVRSQSPSNELNNLLSEGSSVVLNLAELNKNETAELIISILGNKIVISELMLEQIHYRTSGNPLMIIKFVEYMFNNQLLKKEVDHWYFTPEATSQSLFPNNLQDVVKLNYQKLAKKQKIFLTKLFFIRSEFDEDCLVELFEEKYQTIVKNLFDLKYISLISAKRNGKLFVPSIVYESLINEIENIRNTYFLEKILNFLIEKKEHNWIELKQIINLATKLDKIEILIKYQRKIVMLYENSFDITSALYYQKEILKIQKKYKSTSQAGDIFSYARLLNKNKKLLESEKYLNDAISKAQKEDDSLVYLQAIKYKTWNFFLQGKYEESITCNLKTIEVAKRMNEKKILAQSLGNMGNIYNHKKEYKKALGFFLKQQKMSKENGDMLDYLTGMGNIANILINQKDYRKAEIEITNYLREAKKIDHKIHIAIAYGRFGALNLRKKNWHKALEYYNKKWELIKDTAKIYQKAATLSKIAYLNLMQKNYNQALFFYQENLTLLLQLGNFFDAGLTQKKIGELYLKLSLYKDAEEVFRQALQHLKRANRMDVYFKTKLLLINIYITNDQSKKATEQLEELKMQNNDILPKADILLSEAKLYLPKKNNDRHKLSLISMLIDSYKNEKDENKKEEMREIINKYFNSGLFQNDSSTKSKTSVLSQNEEIWTQPTLLKNILNMITPQTAYNELLNYLIHVCHADNCQIVAYDTQTADIQPLLISPELKENPPDFSKTILDNVLYDKKDIFLPNAVDLSKFNSSESIIGKTFLSVIAIPLALQNYKHSALYLDRRRLEKGSFDRSDLRKTREIGKLITPLIDKYEEIFNLEAKVKMEGLDLMIGSSSPMQKLYEQVRKAANYDIPVLIMGESGTGKDLIAQTIHRLANEFTGEFIALNCAAIPHDLAESILFGHEKGAFTGAVNLNIGKFEQAQGGTLFLDEIGELPLNLQAKLLRVLETHTLTRLGGRTTIKLNVKIIAATNIDLNKEVEKGTFRNDLFHRLNIFSIYVPPLRERKEDIPYLAKHFLITSKYADKRNIPDFSPACINSMLNYDWSKNNVRELKNKIEKSLILAKGKKLLNPEDIFPEDHLSIKNNLIDLFESISGGKMDDILKKVERKVVEKALKGNNWNKSRTARQLGISRPRLDKIIKENVISKKV